MKAAALALLMAAAIVGPAWAQADEPATPAATDTIAQAQTPGAEPPAAPVDAAKLGVSMNRIRQGLRVSEAREQRAADGLKFEFQVQVYGAAPRIDILKDFDIRRGAPLQYGAPTHAEFLNQWTPQAYRSPRVPVSSMAGWALFQLVKRADKSKCEQEIAEYRALVMQGVSAPAPRCAQ